MLDPAVVREQAAILRRASAGLRRETHRVVLQSSSRRAVCMSACRDAGRAADARRFRSAWSDLDWRHPGSELERVLMPLDGRR
jgi:hypothetical protein